jgi:chromosome segregation ATPase
LVNKLINDKDFFFGNILIDKNVGNLKKKYPEIFDLLSEKESLEECSKAFEKEKEGLINIINDYKDKNNDLENEIKELNEKLENSKSIIEEKGRLYDVKVSNFKNLQDMHTDLKFKMQEKEVKFKDALKKAKDEEFLRAKNIFMKEINGLNDAIHSIFSKDKSSFFKSLENLSPDSKVNLVNWEILFKPKWI